MYKVITTAFSMHAMNSFAQNMNHHNDNIIYNVNDKFGDLPSELI
jgi:hypothetical protein